MKKRLRAAFGIDTLVPTVLVTIAIIVSLEPTVFGVTITDRQIILAFVGFLGIDSMLERTGRLSRIELKLNGLDQRVSTRVSVDEVLRTRASFERMDVLVRNATQSVLIIGINLEGAVASLPELIRLARSRVMIRLLAMDPHGAALEPTAAMSGINATIRRQKIIQNLDLLQNQFSSNLSKIDRRRVQLKVTNRILPVGVIGIDTATRQGLLTVQHYLIETPAEHAPLIQLRRDIDESWFNVYLAQCEACFKSSRDWQNEPGA